MVCPRCASDQLGVLDSRKVSNANVIKRKRICKSCNIRFLTYEIIIAEEDFESKQANSGKKANKIERVTYKYGVDVGKDTGTSNSNLYITGPDRKKLINKAEETIKLEGYGEDI